MVTFAEGVKNALRTFPCFALRNGEYAYGFAARIFPLSPAGSVADGVNSLRRLLGCDPTDDPPPPEPPFTGGQCSGVLYNITWSGTTYPFSDCSGPMNVGSNLIGVPGPITNLRGEIDPVAPNPPCASQNIYYFDFGPSAQRQTLFGQTNGAVLNSFTVTRTDGQPDDCGNPPVSYPPPSDIDIDIDVTYNIEDGPDITVTVPFIFSPVIVDLSGNFSAPFTFNFGGLDFSGTLRISPKFNVYINPPTAPRGTDDGTEDLPPGDPDEDVEPTPVDEKIIGVAVVSALVGEQQLTTITTENIPTIFAPRAGSIKFAYSVGVSTFWSDDIDIKGSRTFIPCPFSQGADAVAVSPAPGVNVVWRSITGYPLATVNDLD